MKNRDGRMNDVIEYCRDRLHIRHDLDVIVTECCLKQDGAWGWTYDMDDKEIEVEIEQSLSLRDKMITLCHEMVHVKQYSEGRDADEDEAYGLEEVLYNEFTRQ
jgi:hypothetical protein